MIVLNVIYKCKPDMREEFLEAIMTEGIDVASRSEAGNIRYDYYIPVNGGDDLLLVEKWKDRASLDLHGRQAHFARLGKLKAEFVTDTIIERYETQE